MSEPFTENRQHLAATSSSVDSSRKPSVSGTRTPPNHSPAAISATPFSPVEFPSLQASQDQSRVLEKRVSQLTRSMHDNLQLAIQRGEGLTELEQKTQDLQFKGKQFSRTSTQLNKELWWEDHEWHFKAFYAILVVTLIIIIYIVLKQFMFPFI